MRDIALTRFIGRTYDGPGGTFAVVQKRDGDHVVRLVYGDRSEAGWLTLSGVQDIATCSGTEARYHAHTLARRMAGAWWQTERPSPPKQPARKPQRRRKTAR